MEISIFYNLDKGKVDLCGAAFRPVDSLHVTCDIRYNEHEEYITLVTSFKTINEKSLLDSFNQCVFLGIRNKVVINLEPSFISTGLLTHYDFKKDFIIDKILKK